MTSKASLATIIVLALAISACASQRKIPSREAVEDYVSVAELEEVDQIRYTRMLDRSNLNEYYVLLSDRKKHYLAEFVRRCHELSDNSYIKPDIRREHNVIRARSDTIRGCRIKALYSLNEGQAAELRSLGDAPGDTLN